jgi:hypothetical protein
MQQSFILSIVVPPVLPDMTSTSMMEAFSTRGHLHSLIRLAIVHLDYRHSLSCHHLQRPSDDCHCPFLQRRRLVVKSSGNNVPIDNA